MQLNAKDLVKPKLKATKTLRPLDLLGKLLLQDALDDVASPKAGERLLSPFAWLLSQMNLGKNGWSRGTSRSFLSLPH